MLTLYNIVYVGYISKTVVLGIIKFTKHKRLPQSGESPFPHEISARADNSRIRRSREIFLDRNT